jgi:hypothetical protein
MSNQEQSLAENTYRKWLKDVFGSRFDWFELKEEPKAYLK